MRRAALMVVALLGCAGTSPASTGTGTTAQALAAGLADRGLGDRHQPRDLPRGGEASFAADVGQVVVIDAWATWCAPCVRSLPQLQKLGRDYSQRGVRVYAVSVDEDRAQIPTFLATARVQLTVLLDPERLGSRTG